MVVSGAAYVTTVWAVEYQASDAQGYRGMALLVVVGMKPIQKMHRKLCLGMVSSMVRHKFYQNTDCIDQITVAGFTDWMFP